MYGVYVRLENEFTINMQEVCGRRASCNLCNAHRTYSCIAFPMRTPDCFLLMEMTKKKKPTQQLSEWRQVFKLRLDAVADILHWKGVGPNDILGPFQWQSSHSLVTHPNLCNWQWFSKVSDQGRSFSDPRPEMRPGIQPRNFCMKSLRL